MGAATKTAPRDVPAARSNSIFIACHTLPFSSSMDSHLVPTAHITPKRGMDDHASEGVREPTDEWRSKDGAGGTCRARRSK